MLRKRATVALLLLSLGSGLVFSVPDAIAQKKEGKRGSAKKREADDIEAPVDMSKFPGAGSIDAWKTSVPEFRSGMEQMRQHKWDDAIAHFRASIALYQYQPRAFLEIGKAIEAKDGLVSDAENAYRQCIKLDSQSWAGWKGLSNTLYIQKRYAEAREAVSNALNLNPPPKAREQMDKLVQMINAAKQNADTSGVNQGL